MNIAVKLGKKNELRSLLDYNGPFKWYELPARLLEEDKTRVKELIHRDFNFNVHGPSLYSREMAGQFIKDSRHYLDMCDEIGCRQFILHGMIFKAEDREQIDKLIVETLGEIKDHAEKLGIRCFLENGCFLGKKSGKNFEVPSDPKDHVKFATTLGMGMVLDLGHAALSAKWYGRKLEEFLEPYVREDRKPEIIHLSDNLLEVDDHIAIDSGRADIRIYEQVIKKWSKALLTIENFPKDIYKSLSWVIQHSNGGYRQEDVTLLSNSMEWEIEKI